MSQVIHNLLIILVLASQNQFIHGSIDFQTSFDVLGLHVDTVPFVEKLESALRNYPTGFGRTIMHKLNGTCLDGGHFQDMAGNGNGTRYLPVLSKCDSTASTQQWRMIDRKLAVGSLEQLPKVGGGTPCLEADLDEDEFGDFPAENITLRVWVSKCIEEPLLPHSTNAMQYFTLWILPNQLDLVQKKLYFVIHDITTKCLSSREGSGTQAIYLAECNGHDDQSFHLDLDFSKEITEIASKIPH